MNKLLKIAVACFVLGILVPATPSAIRGDFAPEGFLPGGFLLLGTLHTPFDALDTYYATREEPAFGFDHFRDDTLIPMLKGFGVALAVLSFVLVAVVPRIRTGRSSLVCAIVLLIGGLCFARLLFPGYAPSGNRYYYYPGAYLLIAAFPLAAYSLLRHRRDQARARIRAD